MSTEHPDRASLRGLRDRVGIPAKEVAEYLGISQTSLSRFETGARDLPRGMTADDYVSAIRTLASAGSPQPDTEGSPQPDAEGGQAPSTTGSVFFAVPFDPQRQWVFDELSKVLSEYGYRAVRADDYHHAGFLLRDIVSPLYSSSFVVADLSGLNPNVLYELGLAHGLGTPVIMLTDDISTLPFDLKAYRTLAYGSSFEDFTVFLKDFRATVSEISAGSLRFGSPVSDVLQRPVREPGLPAGIAVALNQVDEDVVAPSLLDEYESFITGIADVVGVMNAMPSAFSSANDKITRATQILSESQQEMSPRERVNRMRIAAQLAIEGVRDYRKVISQTRSAVSERWRSIDTSLQALLANPASNVANDPESPAAAAQFATLERSALEMRGTLQEVSHAMTGMLGFDRTLNREVADTSDEIDAFTRLVDDMAATFRRASQYLQVRLAERPDALG